LAHFTNLCGSPGPPRELILPHIDIFSSLWAVLFLSLQNTPFPPEIFRMVVVGSVVCCEDLAAGLRPAFIVLTSSSSLWLQLAWR
jgi:hypothetical protein